ncbi:MAG: ACT domain-containing protein [Chloroflexi bacterium]|nr:ACT domain-containing protein [Chloroflexota bacterium]
MSLTLSVLPERYAACRFDSNEPIPAWATRSQFFTVTRTTDELSITCPEADVPRDVAKCEPGWRAFKLHGPFDFGLTGILTSVLNPLAEAGVGIFALSTFDTDYVLVKEENVEKAIEALRKFGHIFKT